MGLFSMLFESKSGGGDGRYRSDEAHAKNRSRQLTMTPQTVAQLRNYGVTDERQLKLEYFFYTNTKPKAAALAQKLADMGYAGGYDHAATNKNEFVIKGWTSPMKMDDKTALDWTASMCDLGQEHDCDFDGWGTNPKQ
jgi:hypothetical protein